MATKHTPGPWTLAVGASPLDAVWNAEGEFKIASFIKGRNHDWQEQDANACLIAAAPDLLAAAKHAAQSLHHPACRCHGEYSSQPDLYCSCHVQKARAAVAKAERQL